MVKQVKRNLNFSPKKLNDRAYRRLVVTQVLERLPLTPEIRGSNPAIGNFYSQSTALKR